MKQSGTRSRGRVLGTFLVALGLALIAAIAVMVWAIQHLAEGESIRDSQERTQLLARAVVEKELPPGLVKGDPEAIAKMDQLVHDRVLSQDVTRVKIWGPDGTILYSDESRLNGRQFHLGGEESSILSSGGIEAEISDLTKPENALEDPSKPLLEVYLPIKTPEGETVLYENYFSYTKVQNLADAIRKDVMPIPALGLALFALLVTPLAWRMASQLQRDQEVKTRLLRNAVESSDAERRRIAADLHDGVVQDLTGLAFSLAGVAEQLKSEQLTTVGGSGRRATDIGGGTHKEVLDAADRTRNAVTALRSLLVEIYPPNLREAGLPSALDGLLGSPRARGMKTSLDCPSDLEMSPDSEALVFRVAQEAIRNVIKHAHASSLHVEVIAVEESVLLIVRDDGVGIRPTAMSEPEEGHYGLRVLSDLAEEAGGSLSISRSEPTGTILELEVPR